MQLSRIKISAEFPREISNCITIPRTDRLDCSKKWFPDGQKLPGKPPSVAG